MARFLHPFASFTLRKSGCFLLALFWVLGLGFGGLVFRYAGSNFLSLMPLAYLSHPSIVGLLISSLLPFLFAAFAVYISAPWLLHVIGFSKAFLFGYVSAGVYASHPGGWLIWLLFLSADIGSMILLYHYCLRHISGFRIFSLRPLAGYSTLIILLVWMDHSYISPLLQRCLL